MQALALTHRDDFDAALEVARKIGQGGEVSGLAAPLGAALRGHLSDAWDHIESTLEQAWTLGRGFARGVAEATAIKVQEIVDAAGEGAHALHNRILEKLNGYISALIDRALARVRPVITVAGNTLQLESVELVETLTLSGSLQLSITDVCALTAEGEIEIKASYAA
jgi:hypothetical protein